VPNQFPGHTILTTQTRHHASHHLETTLTQPHNHTPERKFTDTNPCCSPNLKNQSQSNNHNHVLQLISVHFEQFAETDV
jgi:hypothetical protein